MRPPPSPLGLPHVHERSVDSTNDRARALGAAGAPHGTLVTADSQSAGRGRQGRRWETPPGHALLASVVVRELAERHTVLPLTAAVAACEACEALAAVECRIKWSNDVWIDRRKVAGILIEGRPQEGWAVVGVGVNVTTPADAFPPDLRGRATSLRLATGSDDLSIVALRTALMRALAERLEHGASEVLARWRERDALLGERVRWHEGSGIAAGVDEAGALLVDTASGRVSLDAGEVHLG